MYLNSSQIAPDCEFPQPGPALTETCFPGGYWPTTCGFKTLDLDWQGSEALAGGNLVAWAGDVSGFDMACTLTGAACQNGTQMLSNLTETGRRSSNSSIRTVGRNSTGSSQTCVRAFDAQAPFICSAGAGFSGANKLMIIDQAKFQLPASFFVYVSPCCTLATGCRTSCMSVSLQRLVAKDTNCRASCIYSPCPMTWPANWPTMLCWQAWPLNVSPKFAPLSCAEHNLHR